MHPHYSLVWDNPGAAARLTASIHCRAGWLQVSFRFRPAIRHWPDRDASDWLCALGAETKEVLGTSGASHAACFMADSRAERRRSCADTRPFARSGQTHAPWTPPPMPGELPPCFSTVRSART